MDLVTHLHGLYKVVVSVEFVTVAIAVLQRYLYLACCCSYSGQVACNFGIHWFVRLMVPALQKQRLF